MSIQAPTHHIAAEKGDFAKTVLMPGDPLRAQFIAETYLEDMKQINAIRCMYAYTGFYKGKKVSVMAGGIGIPSTATHAWELYNLYDVKNIIRVGTTGGMADGLEVGDIIFAMGACYHTRLVEQYRMPGTYSAIASYPLLQLAVDQAKAMDLRFKVGNVISSDIFYPEEGYSTLDWTKLGVLSVEMETAALYTLAARHGKQALSILTVSDHLVTGVKASADDRQKSFTAMMELALEIAE
jgi:purine-nucleoside phosphorylase